MKNICLTFVLVLAAGLAHAQWNRTALNIPPSRVPSYLDAPAPGVVWVVQEDLVSPAATAVSVSSTGGQTWATRPVGGLGPDEFIVGISALDATTAWLAVATVGYDPVTMALTLDGRVLHTANAGQSWQTQVASGQLTNAIPTAVQFFSATLGVALGQSGNGFEGLRTTDGGLTWTALPALPLPITGEALLSSPPARIGNHLWVGTTEGRVLHTPDAGLSWQTSTALFNGANAYQVAFRDALHGVLTSTDAANASLVVATADGGLTWSAPRPQPWTSGPLMPAPAPNGRQTVLLSQAGSAVTADDGLTQRVLETQLLHVAGRMVSATEGYAAVVDTLTGAGTGVYRLAPAALAARPAGPRAAPAAYPNPSPDGRFWLPAPAAAPGTTWRVLDAQGREVRAAQPLPAAPAPALVDLRDCAPGCYLLELRPADGPPVRQPLLRP